MDSKAPPRRLLSFDSQNPWTRFKVFSRPTGRSPVEEPAGRRAGLYTAAGPILSMSASQDRKLAAVLGPNFLDIVEVFADPHLLRSVPLDPKLLPTTVEWGQQATKTQAAVASTGGSGASGGSIQLYSSAGQVLASGDGLRSPMTSLSFSSMAVGNVLAGASIDGSVRLWDLRQGLRRPVSTFARQGDIARQVQFHPEQETKFAVIYDSGMAQRWDVRKPSATDVRIVAHMQGLTLNWHPTANYLATGGRDHRVNVWNFNTESKSPEYTINTASPVGRVRWMPGDNGMTSSAIVTSGRSAAGSNSRSVKYWLLKSPWVPLYSLDAHTDSIMDLAVANSNVVWSASKDKTLVQHDLRFEPLVYDNFAPAVSQWSGAHSVVISTNEKLHLSHHMTPVQTPQPIDEEQETTSSPATPAIASSSAISGSSTVPPRGSSGNKTPTSLSFLGSSFTVQNSPASSVSSSNATTPAGSYFTSMPISSPVTPMVGSHDNTHSLAAGLNRMLDGRHLSPIVEMDFLPPRCGVLDSRVNQYLFEPLPRQSLGSTCLYNAQLETPLHTSNLWQMLAAAIEDIEAAYLATVSGKTHEIAQAWFKGEIHDSGSVDASVALVTSATPSISNESPPETPQYDWGGDTWQLSGVSFNSEASEETTMPPRRPSVHHTHSTKSVVPYEQVQLAETKANFLAFAASQSQPWGFLPILRGLIEQSVEDGLVYTTTALVLLFQRFRAVIDLPNTDEVVVSCIEIMRSQQLFVTAAHLMGITSVWQKEMGVPDTTLDVVCHHCKSSLSENLAFFKNDSVTGYWYCGRCKQMQHGCSVCNIAVKGLGIVMPCGHRTHGSCWSEWIDMGMDECPAGCGSVI